MRAFVMGILALEAAGIAALALSSGTGMAEPAVSRITVGGFTLSSSTIDLSVDEPGYPDGPDADTVTANCSACHSAAMALTQPRLSAAQWKAIVEKMRGVYKAPVAEEDVPAIVAYLTAMSDRLPAAPDAVPAGAARP